MVRGSGPNDPRRATMQPDCAAFPSHPDPLPRSGAEGDLVVPLRGEENEPCSFRLRSSFVCNGVHSRQIESTPLLYPLPFTKGRGKPSLPGTRAKSPSGSDRFLDLPQRLKSRPATVMLVQRITAADQTVARRGCAITESAADGFFLEHALFEGVGEDVRISEGHAAQTDHVRPAMAHHVLRDVREVFLEVGVSRADEDWHRISDFGFRISDLILNLAHHSDLARHADQRVLGRLIAVARRVNRRALDVR